MVNHKNNDRYKNRKYIQKAFRAFQMNSLRLDMKTTPELTDDFCLDFKGDSEVDSEIEDFISLFCKAFNGLPAMYRKIIWLTEVEMFVRPEIALEFDKSTRWLSTKKRLAYKEFADRLS